MEIAHRDLDPTALCSLSRFKQGKKGYPQEKGSVP